MTLFPFFGCGFGAPQLGQIQQTRNRSRKKNCPRNWFSVTITLGKDVLQCQRRRNLLLCEYMCQCRQQGAKRCELISGPDLIDLSVSRQVELLVEQLSIDALQRQSSFASFTEKSQVRVGTLHCACLSVYGLLDTFPVHRDRRCTLASLRRLPLRW
jgi:hypothetical protein